jgi:F-type H+-transporting ATPase subunit b
MSEMSVTLPELAAMAGVTIDLDITSVVSALIFLVLLLVLNQVVFQPYLRIVEKRDGLTSGAQGSAGEQEREAEALESAFRSAMAQARAESARIRDGLKAEGKTESERCIAEARAEVSQRRAEAREALERDLDAASGGLHDNARELSKAIVARMTTVKG